MQPSYYISLDLLRGDIIDFTMYELYGVWRVDFLLIFDI